MAKGKRRDAFEESESEYFDQMLDSAKQEIEPPTGGGRGKPAHSGTRGVDSTGRSKATYDISIATQDAIREIAVQEGVHISDIVEAAMRMFIQAHNAGTVDLHPFKAPTKSLKAMWKLKVPEDFDFFSG